MDFEVGSILEGKVTGITKFGAFVQLAPGKSGLVHISEVANTYVSDVNEFLTVGQQVQVKVIGIDQTGRINLSVKQVQAAPERPARAEAARVKRPAAVDNPPPQTRSVSAPVQGEVLAPSKDTAFEDKLKKFMQDADSKMSGVRIYSDNKRSSRRRK